MVRLPRVALGLPPWRGGILLLNHNRGKLKGRELFHSRPMPFQQRTNTSCYLAIPTHGFTVVLSVFGGTPPAKPLNCKIRLNSSGALFCDLWADPTGGEPRLSCAFLIFVPGDIIKTSVSFYSQFYAFRFHVRFCFGPSWAIKNPASVPVSRVWKSYNGSVTCLPFYPYYLRGIALNMIRIVRG